MDFKLNFSAEKTKTQPLDQSVTYDVLIIGGGPAAQTAAVYCMRKGVKTGIITKNFGGQLAETSSVENYMGYKFINGMDLVKKFKEQIEQFELGVLDGFGASAIKNGAVKTVITENGSEYRAKSLIITTGKTWRKLNVPGEIELTGKGVAYCSICDAPLFSDKRVAVAGGGNSAVESAIDLARIATEVVIVQLLPDLTADSILIEKLKSFSNIKYIFESEVVEIKGSEQVESILINNRAAETIEELKVDGIFIEIGLIPESQAVKGVLDLNSSGEIIIDSACRTSADGIFAAGDVTSVPYKQIIIAAGEGAKAALSACEYVLKDNNN